MKHSIYYSSIAFVFCAFIGTSVYAQWNPPSGLPPEGNVPTLITVGNTAQKKIGQNTGIVLRVDPNWSIPAVSQFSLLTDKSVFVQHKTINPQWGGFAPDYGFTTNAPLSVNGVFSRSNIRTGDVFTAKTVFVENLKISGQNSVGGRKLCTENDSGKVIPCAAAVVQAKPTASISLSRNTITAATPQTISVSWSSTNAEKCYAAEGGGFITGGATSGSDTSEPLTLNSGDTHAFTVICIDTAGNAAYDSKDVTVSGSPAAPQISLTLNGQSDSLVVPGTMASNQFPIRATLSGGTAPDWCKRWTTWNGNLVNNGPKGVDPEWPGTSSAKVDISPGSILGASGYVVNAAPVGWKNFENDPDSYHTGIRTYWLECGNQWGSSAVQVTLNLY
jgi:hypothetical protein